MVVIVVLAVLLVIALPNFSAFVKDNRLSGYSADIQSAMSFARSQAISRRRNITICPSSDSMSCNGTHWSDGLLVFVDGQTLGAADSGDDILKSVQLADAFAKIDPLASDNFGGKSYLTYRPSGTVMNAGTLLICDDRVGNVGYQLRVWTTGRVELTSRQSCS